MIKRIVILFALLNLVSCTGFLITPNGLTCSGGDINIGGGNEASSLADASRKSCDPSGRRKSVRACCYKELLIITNSCPLKGGSLKEGDFCNCYFRNGFGFNVVRGIACRKSVSNENENDD